MTIMKQCQIVAENSNPKTRTASVTIQLQSASTTWSQKSSLKDLPLLLQGDTLGGHTIYLKNKFSCCL
jgi:Ulp1 family protease